MFVPAVSQQPGPDAGWSSLMWLQSLGLEFLLLNNHAADFQHFLVQLSTNLREDSQCTEKTPNRAPRNFAKVR